MVLYARIGYFLKIRIDNSRNLLLEVIWSVLCFGVLEPGGGFGVLGRVLLFM